MVSRSDLGLGVDIEVLDELLDRLRAHRALEVLAIAVDELAVEVLVDDQLLGSQLGEGGPDLVEAIQLTLDAVAELAHLALAGILDLALDIRLCAFGLKLLEVGLELLGTGLQVDVTLVGDSLLLDDHLGLERGELVVAHLGVHGGDHVGREVDDLLEILRGQIEQITQPGRDTLEVPDVGYRCSQFDMAHPLATHLGASDLDAATLADDALEAHPLVLAAVALPVASRSEDLLAEEAILLRLEGAVVDGLRLLHLAVGPIANIVGGGQADAEFIEEVDV